MARRPKRDLIALPKECLQAVAEVPQRIPPTEQQELVVGFKNGIVVLSGQVFVAAHDADDPDVFVIGESQLRQTFALEIVRYRKVDQVVAFAQAEVIAHQRIVQHLRDVLADLLFRMDDAGSAQAIQDLVVSRVDRLGPDGLHTEQLDVHGAKHVGFEIVTDRDHGNVVLVHTGFTQRFLIADIGDDGFGEFFITSLTRVSLLSMPKTWLPKLTSWVAMVRPNMPRPMTTKLCFLLFMNGLL